jgi:putative ABC transport system permease protein
MLLVGTVVAMLALNGAPRGASWYDPRYALPLFGMTLGNAMTGISLGLGSLTSLARQERADIEAQLILDASHRQALWSRALLRTGVI